MTEQGKKRAFILPFLIFIPFIFWSVSTAEADSIMGTNAVLVLDSSFSMNANDKDKISQEAMKMFVDLTATVGNNIGILSYTDRIIKKQEIISISNEEHKQKLKDFIDSLERGPYTDISVGLLEAIEMLDSQKEQEKKSFIILLADGNNDLNPALGKTEEEALQDLEKGITLAREKNYPVYVIGLNTDGLLNIDLLQSISEKTGGRFFATSSALTLPNILGEVFADFYHLKIQDLPKTGGSNYNISIPNAAIQEANIIITGEVPRQFTLLTPDQENALETKSVFISPSNKYTLIKLIEPLKGNWHLSFSEGELQDIRIKAIYLYDIEVTMAPLSQKYLVDEPIQIKAYVNSGGESIDLDNLANLKGTLIVKNKATGDVAEMNFDQEQNYLTAQFIPSIAGEYEFLLRVENEHFVKEVTSKPIQISEQVLPPSEEFIDEQNPTRGFLIPWGTLLTISVLGILSLLITLVLVRNRRRKKYEEEYLENLKERIEKLFHQ